MKKNLKAFMGKALAGTMLVTSTFAGAVIASESVSNNVAALAGAETTTSGGGVDDNTSGGSTTEPSTSGGSTTEPSTSGGPVDDNTSGGPVDDNTSGGSVDDGDEDAVVNHTYSFANVPADTVIPTGKDAATNGYYMVASNGTLEDWKAIADNTANCTDTGAMGAYVVSDAAGNYVRIADANSESPALRFDASAESVSRAATGKVTYTAKVAWEKVGSSMAVFNLVSGETTVLTVGTGNNASALVNDPKVTADKTKIYARVNDETGTAQYYGNSDAIAPVVNTFYEISATVDKATKTASVTVNGKLVADNIPLSSTTVDEISIQGSGKTSRSLRVKDVSAVSENASSGGDVETGATFTKVISDTLTITATNGTLDITGSDVESFDASTNALVLKSTTKLDATSIVNKINEGTDVVASKQADGIKLTQGNKTPIVFTVTVKSADTPVETGITFTKEVSNTLTVVASGGALDITGSDVVSFDKKTNALVLKSTTALTVDTIVRKLGEVEGLTANKKADGSVELTQGNKTPIVFTVTIKTADTPVETGITFTKEVSNTLTVVASGGALDIEGSDVDSFNKKTNALVLKSTTALTVDTIVSKLGEVEGLTATKEADGSVKLAQEGKTSIVFTVTIKTAEDPVKPTSSVLKSETIPVGTTDLSDLKKGDQIDVIYRLDEVLSINNFTFYVDFDPAVLTLEGAQTVADSEAVTYQLSGVGAMQLITKDLITKQQAVVPAVGDTDYDNALGGKADGVKTAAQLGRLKLAGVAGLNGDDSSTAVTDTKGILFKLRFTVSGSGSTKVGINSVGGAAANEIFYSTPKSEQGAEAVEIGDTIETPEIEVPKTTQLVYSYDANGVVISAKDGKLTISGTAVKSYANDVVTLKSDADITVDALIADIKAKAPEGITVTNDGAKVTISDGTNSVEFTVKKADAEPTPDPEPTGDVVVKITGKVDDKVVNDEIRLAVGETGLTATTTAKGKVKEVAGGVYVPVTRGIELSKLTAADFAVEGATVKAYDATVADLTVTIDGKDYVVGLYEVGDVDLNASANINDALNIVKYVNGEVQYTDKRKLAGDVDANESANINDALSIVKYVNGEFTEFGSEK